MGVDALILLRNYTQWFRAAGSAGWNSGHNVPMNQKHVYLTKDQLPLPPHQVARGKTLRFHIIRTNLVNADLCCLFCFHTCARKAKTTFLNRCLLSDFVEREGQALSLNSTPFPSAPGGQAKNVKISHTILTNLFSADLCCLFCIRMCARKAKTTFVNRFLRSDFCWMQRPSSLAHTLDVGQQTISFFGLALTEISVFESA